MFRLGCVESLRLFAPSALRASVATLDIITFCWWGRSLGNDDESQGAGHLAQPITDVMHRFAFETKSIDFQNFIAGVQLAAPFGGTALDDSAYHHSFTFVPHRCTLIGSHFISRRKLLSFVYFSLAFQKEQRKKEKISLLLSFQLFRLWDFIMSHFRTLCGSENILLAVQCILPFVMATRKIFSYHFTSVR